MKKPKFCDIPRKNIKKVTTSKDENKKIREEHPFGLKLLLPGFIKNVRVSTDGRNLIN